MLREWSHKRSCTRHQLESLLGYLSHAATVTPQGRTFLRSLFSILSRTLQPHHHMRLNRCARADLAWWNTFLQGWNGKSFFPGAKTTLEVTSDASGSYGCGAIFGNTWFQASWPPSWEAISITAKELVPIVIAAAFWGSQWTKSRVHFFCDNMAVVALLKTLTSKDALIMHLLRCLAFYAAHYGFEIESYHIPGVQNVAADAISRNISQLLVLQIPDWGPLEPSTIPAGGNTPNSAHQWTFPLSQLQITHRLTSSHISPFQSTGRLLDRTSARDYQTQV